MLGKNNKAQVRTRTLSKGHKRNMYATRIPKHAHILYRLKSVARARTSLKSTAAYEQRHTNSGIRASAYGTKHKQTSKDEAILIEQRRTERSIRIGDTNEQAIEQHKVYTQGLVKTNNNELPHEATQYIIRGSTSEV